MSDGDADTSCSASTTFESSLVSKPSVTCCSASKTSSDPTRTSSDAPLYHFVNYDPFYYRNHSHHTSYSSVVDFICQSSGMGLLCMPYAFQQVGAAVGLALCVFAGLTFSYSYNVLCRFRYKICQIQRVPYCSYQDLIVNSLALGPRVISSFSYFFNFMFIYTNLALDFGTNCLYMKFVSTAIQELSAELGFPIDVMESCLIYTTICFVFLLLPSPKYLEPSMSVYCQISCTILLCYVCSHMLTSEVQIDIKSLVRGDWVDVFYFFGILLFAYVPAAQVLEIEDQLIIPQDFIGPPFGLLKTSMTLVTNLYVGIGLWGYLNYQNIPEIGYSLLRVMPNNKTRNLVKSFFVAHIALSHQIICSESASVWWSSMRLIQRNEEHPSSECCSAVALAWLTAAIKITFTTCSFLVAVTALTPLSEDPRGLGQVMALTGYLGNAWNVLVFPHVIELCLTHALYGMSVKPFAVAKDVLLVVFGLSVFAYGTFTMVNGISNEKRIQ